jgi:membrane-associated phospholipid phosphatase
LSAGPGPVGSPAHSNRCRIGDDGHVRRRPGGRDGGVLAFALSAVRALPDPIDPAEQERAVVRGLDRWPRLRRFLRERLDRRTAGGILLTMALFAAFAASFLVGALLDMVEGSYGLAALDDDVAQWGVANADTATVETLKKITYLGDTAVVVAALIAAGVIDYCRHRRGEVFVFLLVVIGGEKLIVNGLKELVDRARPDILPLVGWDGPSFPSGHAAAAAAVWPAIVLVLGRGGTRTTRALLAATAALIAIAVAASRAMLGVHWLTDVVAGLAIGYCWFFIGAVMFGGRAQRLGDPVTTHSEGTTAHPDRITRGTTD